MDNEAAVAELKARFRALLDGDEPERQALLDELGNPREFAAGAIKDYLATVFAPQIEDINKLALQLAVDAMGIPIDLDGEVSKESVTRAICDNLLGGELQFTNLFDREAVQRDVRRMALEHAAQALGFDASLGMRGMRDNVIARALNKAREQAGDGVGELVEAATDSPHASAIISKPKKEGYSDVIIESVRPGTGRRIEGFGCQNEFSKYQSKGWFCASDLPAGGKLLGGNWRRAVGQ
jgi:hypothetical protein